MKEIKYRRSGEIFHQAPKTTLSSLVSTDLDYSFDRTPHHDSKQSSIASQQRLTTTSFPNYFPTVLSFTDSLDYYYYYHSSRVLSFPFIFESIVSRATIELGGKKVSSYVPSTVMYRYYYIAKRCYRVLAFRYDGGENQDGGESRWKSRPCLCR